MLHVFNTYPRSRAPWKITVILTVVSGITTRTGYPFTVPPVPRVMGIIVDRYPSVGPLQHIWM